MTRTAVTGASGFLGSILHKVLKERNADHCLLLRKPVPYIEHHDVVYGGLDSPTSIGKLVKGCSTVIHSAGMVWPKFGPNPLINQVNFEYSRQLFDICLDSGVQHFIYISSIQSMVAPPPDEPFDESAELLFDPDKAYDHSKAEMERFLMGRHDMKVTIFNPTAIIGPGDIYLRSFNQLFYRIHSRRLPVLTNGGFNVVDVRDVAAAIVYAAEHGKAGKYIIGGGYHSIRELALLYGKISGRWITPFTLPNGFLRLISRTVAPVMEQIRTAPSPFNSYAVEAMLSGHPGIDSSHAREDLCFHPRPVEDTLEDLFIWFESERGKLPRT